MGTAVNQREAYRAFHSKTFSKRRSEIKPAAQKRTPQVGKDTNIEYVLTDPSFAERVAPPKFLNTDDDFVPRILIWGGVIITFPIVIAYEFDLGLWEIGLYALAILISPLFVEAQLKSGLARIRQYNQSWLCLSCGYRWVETKDKARKQ
jgi:hypothetical protein